MYCVWHLWSTVSFGDLMNGALKNVSLNRKPVFPNSLRNLFCKYPAHIGLAIKIENGFLKIGNDIKCQTYNSIRKTFRPICQGIHRIVNNKT